VIRAAGRLHALRGGQAAAVLLKALRTEKFGAYGLLDVAALA
jgi:hypothetical protein